MDESRPRGQTVFYAYNRPWADQIDLGVVLLDDRTDSRYIAKPVEYVPLVDNAAHTPPTLSMPPHEAQALMDALWRVGLRPTEGSGSAGSLAATERHLEDMRALAFSLMPTPLELPKGRR